MCPMFSHDLFDFASAGHLSDPYIDAPDPYHDALFDSYIDSSCVDQSVCSDFACCGQTLPDLHRLLEHFEEEHVLPLPSDARPLFSSPVYAQPRSGPCASYILSYPQPDPPLHSPAAPHSISVSSVSPTPSALPSLQFSGLPPVPVLVPDLTHTPLSPSPTASSATSAHSSPGPGEPLCLPPALFSVRPSSPSRSRGHRDRPRVRAWSDTDMDMDVDDSDEEAPDGDFEDMPPRSRARPAPTSSSASSLSGSGNTSTAGPLRRVKNNKTKHRNANGNANGTSSSSSAARMDARSRPGERERAPVLSPKRRDGREKAFKCPHPGCTKSYLNPNGLKYHLEKGTCTNADARGRDALPSSPSASASPVVAAPPCALTLAARTTATATTLGTGPDSVLPPPPPSSGGATKASMDVAEVRA